MDDEMLDLTAGNAMLRRRLDAYADGRLSPADAAAVRMRTRVMATAHRQAAIARGGAGLTVISNRPVARRHPGRRHPAVRAAGLLVAAGLGLSLAAGSALAAEAGGPLYPARLGLEVLFLPSDPGARAVAELERLEARLAEAGAASERGDVAGMTAALQAYASILDVAMDEAILAGDPSSSAALEAGVARNIAVLQALLDRAPEAAIGGLTRAIERSGTAIDGIPGGSGSSGGGNGNGNGTGGDGGNGGSPTHPTGPEATREPKPTRAATPEPTPRATPERTPRATPERTPRPGRTPHPDRTPPNQAPGGPGKPSGDPTGGD